MKKILFSLMLCGMFLTNSAKSQSCAKSINYVVNGITASTQLVAAPNRTDAPGQSIHICAVSVQVVQSTTAVNWGFVSGTGSICATGQASVTPLYTGTINARESLGQLFGSNSPINLAPAQALCFYLSGPPTGANVQVTYAIY